jgi:MFS family permease
VASAEPAAQATSRWANVRRAFRHRNYRLFFVGQGVSLIGTWLTRVALGWWVFRLTGSELMLGTVSFAGQIPTFLLAPLGGVFVDRANRQHILVVTQALSMSQSLLLTLLALSARASVGYILALAIFQGLINAFDTPARQAFLVQMVEDKADLPNAIALNSSMVNGARLLGPSFAGILIAAFGEAGCFAIDTLSYLAVLLSLFAMRVPPRARKEAPLPVWRELGAGLRYVAHSPPLRAVLSLVALVSLTGAPYTLLMPVFATEILGGGPYTLGFLMAGAGAGAVLGAVWLASRSSVLGLGRTIAAASLTFGFGLMAFALARSLWLALPFVVLAGGGMMVTLASCNTILQTVVDEDKRGRVMSLYTMAFFGMVPFGALFAGWLAARAGAPVTVFAGGAVTAVGGAAFLRNLPQLRKSIRPIYVRLGILPAPSEPLARTALDEHADHG